MNIQNLQDKLYRYFDERLEIKEALEKFLRKPVPIHATNWMFCFGGLTFLMFAIQVVTGVLLMVYYVPTPEQAYKSVQFIMRDVNFGWLIRSLHHWAANGMVLMIGLHMARVFYMGAYKKPRELNWIVGVILLFITLGFGFTGYLLPWDQKAFWATTVASELANSIPFIGPYLLVIMRGGQEISGATLTRFYSVHVFILPAIIVAFLLLHFAIIRRQGISGPL
ncbi:MAG: cytochrome bc complex cytochrome b subunit [Candidatus Methanofastidiosia archaeon]